MENSSGSPDISRKRIKVEWVVQLHRFDTFQTLCVKNHGVLSPYREWATFQPLLAPLALCSCAVQNMFVSTWLACLVKTVVLDFEPCMWDFSPLEPVKRDEGSGSEERSPC